MVDARILDLIINRALQDDDYRRELKNNPAKALQDVGWTPAPDGKDVAALKSLDYESIENVFAAFHDPRAIT